MKNKILIVLLIALLLVSCSSNSEYVKLTPDEAGERILNEEVIILDVRTQAEYDEIHIDGSVLLPLDTIGENTTEVLTDKDAVLFVYCRSGNRSKTASNKLIELGFTNVFDIGGIIDFLDNKYFIDKIISK